MKTKPLQTMTMAALVLGSSAILVGQPEQPKTPAQNAPSSVSANYEDPRGRHASALLGRDVVGANDAKLGQLTNLIVDARSGRLLYGVVSSKGAEHAVPFQAFIPMIAEDGLQMRLNLDQANWQKAPKMETRALSSLGEDSPLRADIYRYFNLPLAVDTQLQTQKTPARLMLVRETIGTPLYRDKETIGTIEDVIVHLEARSAALLVNPPDELVGTEHKFIVPFASLDLERIPGDRLTTTLSPRDFTSAHAATDASWATSAGSFKAPYVWPPYGVSAVPLANTPPPPSVPLRTEELRASRPPVAEIRQGLAADPHTRWTDVKVVAGHDRVILQGVVQDEDDKRRVENRAAEFAGGWNIENRIRIAGTVED